MRKLLLLLAIIALFFIIPVIEATKTTNIPDTYGTSWSSGRINQRMGYIIKVNYNGFLTNITKKTQTSAVSCFVQSYTSKAVLASGSFSGDVCALNYNVNVGDTYFIVVGNNNADWVDYYDNGNNAALEDYANAVNITTSTYLSKSGSDYTVETTPYYRNNIIQINLEEQIPLINISNYTLSSAYSNATAWNNYTLVGIPTWDSTPTVRFTTNLQLPCRMSSSRGVGDKNYTTMTGTRDCDNGTVQFNHVCTLNVSDQLISQIEYLYISCNSTNQTNKSNSGLLNVTLRDIYVNSTKALDLGIQSSVIWPTATIYQNQQVYIRLLNTSQVTGTVERVAVFGNQRWIFNLYNNSDTLNPLIGLFNITPVVYVMEIALETRSYNQIQSQVSTYINNTKI